MPICFVIQPFDKGVFDRRFRDTFAPAIRAADLEPYRVDEDPSVSIPIEQIEQGIRDAHVCLADITVDNANVWFEIGFAIACRKEVLFVCSESRDRPFPFDIQHRTVIKYATGSASDFEQLKCEVTERLKAYSRKAEALHVVAGESRLAKIEGLEQNDVVALVSIAENLEAPDDHVGIYAIKRDMEANGFTRVASMLAINTLLQRGMATHGQYTDEMDHSMYAGYSLTQEGWAWLQSNRRHINLRRDGPATAPRSEDDSVPF